MPKQQQQHMILTKIQQTVQIKINSLQHSAKIVERHTSPLIIENHKSLDLNLYF